MNSLLDKVTEVDCHVVVLGLRVFVFRVAAVFSYVSTDTFVVLESPEMVAAVEPSPPDAITTSVIRLPLPLS